MPHFGVESVWALSSHWELDNPQPGDILPSDGIRIFGSVDAPMATDGVSHSGEAADFSQPHHDYVITGSIVVAQDTWVNFGSGLEHGGTDVVLSVAGELVQARVPGPASSLETGARVSVRGEIHLVYGYEWDAFELVDTRRSWRVQEVRTVEGGTYLLLLTPSD